MDSKGTFFGLVDARPDFGENQIRAKEQLSTGMVVNSVHQRDPTRAPELDRCKVLSEPYQDDSGDWCVRVWYISVNDRLVNGPEFVIYLADKSVVPYHSGKWNKWNWLERV